MRNKLTPQLFDNLAVANKFFIGHIVLGGQGLQPHMIFDSILISLQVLDKPLMLEAGWQGSPGIHGKCLPAMIRVFGRLLNNTFSRRNPESKFVTKIHGFPAMICLFG